VSSVTVESTSGLCHIVFAAIGAAQAQALHGVDWRGIAFAALRNDVNLVVVGIGICTG
jgi:hypothetical protein